MSDTLPDLRRALPTYAQAAQLIEIDASGISRAVARLGLTAQQWGGRDKRLTVVDVLQIAAQARRATVNEVAAGLLQLAELQAPELLPAVSQEIDRYFSDLHPRPQAQPADKFLAEMADSLPARHAETVRRLYQLHVAEEQRQEQP